MEPWVSALTMRLSSACLVGLDASEEVVEVHVTRSLLRGQALLELALGGQATGLGLVFEDGELVTGTRDRGQAQYLDWVGGLGLLDRVALRVDERTHVTEAHARDESVAHAQRTALHDDGRHRGRGPWSRLASMTKPLAVVSGLALSSSTSA